MNLHKSAFPHDIDHVAIHQYFELITWLSKHRPYMTFGFIRSHALSPHHALGFTEDRVTDLLSDFKQSGILVESHRTTDDGRTLRTLELNASHPMVTASYRIEAPRFEDGTNNSQGPPAG